MRPFLIAESIRDLTTPYPTGSRVLAAAAGGTLARTDLVQLWLTEGIPHAFKDCPAAYASMRAWLATRLDVHAKDISMTGSGRFGESWVPTKLGTRFGPDSDLDLFLVSSNFFARLEADFVRWRNDFDQGDVTPRNERQATFWDDHRDRGPTIIRRGFLDAWMIPSRDRYKTGQRVAQTMFLLKRKLAATPRGPLVQKASLRVYRDTTSLIQQESLNLAYAVKQMERRTSDTRHPPN